MLIHMNTVYFKEKLESTADKQHKNPGNRGQIMLNYLVKRQVFDFLLSSDNVKWIARASSPVNISGTECFKAVNQKLALLFIDWNGRLQVSLASLWQQHWKGAGQAITCLKVCTKCKLGCPGPGSAWWNLQKKVSNCKLLWIYLGR